MQKDPASGRLQEGEPTHITQTVWVWGFRGSADEDAIIRASEKLL